MAVAKRDLAVGDKLDGEGGYTVWARAMPAKASVAMGALPIGFAHGLTMTRAVAKGEALRKADVSALPAGLALEMRGKAEAMAG